MWKERLEKSFRPSAASDLFGQVPLQPRMFNAQPKKGTGVKLQRKKEKNESQREAWRRN
jgi:hypothetical protein